MEHGERVGEQIDAFPNDRKVRVEKRLADLIKAMRDAKDAITSKEFGYFISKDASEVDNALSCRDRKVPPLAWVLALIEADPDHHLLRWLADQVGCDVVAKRRLTPEEKLEALTQTLRLELGKDAARLVLRKAGVEV